MLSPKDETVAVPPITKSVAAACASKFGPQVVPVSKIRIEYNLLLSTWTRKFMNFFTWFLGFIFNFTGRLRQSVRVEVRQCDDWRRVAWYVEGAKL